MEFKWEIFSLRMSFLLYPYRKKRPNETDCYTVSVRHNGCLASTNNLSNVTSFSDTFLSSTYNIKLKEWNVTRIYGEKGGREIKKKNHHSRETHSMRVVIIQS